MLSIDILFKSIDQSWVQIFISFLGILATLIVIKIQVKGDLKNQRQFYLDQLELNNYIDYSEMLLALERAPRKVLELFWQEDFSMLEMDPRDRYDLLAPYHSEFTNVKRQFKNIEFYFEEEEIALVSESFEKIDEFFRVLNETGDISQTSNRPDDYVKMYVFKINDIIQNRKGLLIHKMKK